jgi:hypothetical protein
MPAKSIVQSRRVLYDEICDYNNQVLYIRYPWLFYNVVWTANWPPHWRGSTITLRLITLVRIPLDKWSARRRDLYLTTHNTHKRQSSTPPEGLEPAIPASWRPQTHALHLRGHWDRQWIRVFDVIITVTCSTVCTYVVLLCWYVSVSFLCFYRMQTAWCRGLKTWITEDSAKVCCTACHRSGTRSISCSNATWQLFVNCKA